MPMALDPKSSVSTNSTTPAYPNHYSQTCIANSKGSKRTAKIRIKGQSVKVEKDPRVNQVIIATIWGGIGIINREAAEYIGCWFFAKILKGLSMLQSTLLTQAIANGVRQGQDQEAKTSPGLASPEVPLVTLASQFNLQLPVVGNITDVRKAVPIPS